jgi:assimilatory nitrate reductase catalytic subunit
MNLGELMHAETSFPQSRFLQGVFAFAGRGLQEPFRLADGLRYEIPSDKRAQMLYFRGGNSADALIYVVLMQNDRPKRYFPIGARVDTHVTLAITEDIGPGERCEVFMSAPEGVSGWIVIDVGFIEL